MPDRHLFVLTYKKLLERLGLRSAITVGTSRISFDCSRPDNFLLEALKSELEYPTPLALGMVWEQGVDLVKDQDCARVRSVGVVPGFSRGDGKAANTPRLKANAWEVGRDPRIVHLNLPDYTRFGSDRKLFIKEIQSYFRSFIKDSPPKDFTDHRRKLGCLLITPDVELPPISLDARHLFYMPMPRRKMEALVRAPLPRTITLGIMAMDCPAKSRGKVNRGLAWPVRRQEEWKNFN